LLFSTEQWARKMEKRREKLGKKNNEINKEEGYKKQVFIFDF
jgi:hypothetical protein